MSIVTMIRAGRHLPVVMRSRYHFSHQRSTVPLGTTADLRSFGAANSMRPRGPQNLRTTPQITDPLPQDVAETFRLLVDELDQAIPPRQLDRNLLVATWNLRAF